LLQHHPIAEHGGGLGLGKERYDEDEEGERAEDAGVHDFLDESGFRIAFEPSAGTPYDILDNALD
jgi:hypothetical protein